METNNSNGNEIVSSENANFVDSMQTAVTRLKTLKMHVDPPSGSNE